MKRLLWYLARGIVKIGRWLEIDGGIGIDGSGFFSRWAIILFVFGVDLVIAGGATLMRTGVVFVDGVRTEVPWSWTFFWKFAVIAPLGVVAAGFTLWAAIWLCVQMGKAANAVAEFADGPQPPSSTSSLPKLHSSTSARGALSEPTLAGGELSMCDDHCWRGAGECPACEHDHRIFIP